MRRLFDEIAASSVAVRREARAIAMGPAHLTFDEPQPTSMGQGQGASPYGHGWDVAAFSKMSLRASLEHRSYADPDAYTFSATLVFARTREDHDFRWRELSFFNWNDRSPMHPQPMALLPIYNEFHSALSNVVSGWQLAHGPWAVDAEDEQAFQERWINLFAKAAQGRLRPPSQMPLPPSFFN